MGNVQDNEKNHSTTSLEAFRLKRKTRKLSNAIGVYGEIIS
jgi:hypothetical protein